MDYLQFSTNKTEEDGIVFIFTYNNLSFYTTHPLLQSELQDWEDISLGKSTSCGSDVLSIMSDGKVVTFQFCGGAPSGCNGGFDFMLPFDKCKQALMDAASEASFIRRRK